MHGPVNVKLYILLITEHNWDVTPENLGCYPLCMNNDVQTK
jgi:hypothetical protein